MKQNTIDIGLKCGEKRKIMITSSNGKQKLGLKKHFKSHFNTDQTKLKLLAQLECTPIYIQALQNLTSDINNNEPDDELVNKAIKKLTHNKASLVSEYELFKIVYHLSKFRIDFLNLSKSEIRCASHNSGMYRTLITYGNEKVTQRPSDIQRYLN